MQAWTKQQELELINNKQAYYIDELIKLLLSKESKVVKTINFNSSTGTGKTKMMAELFNKMPHIYFIVTTLSRGQLQMQIKQEISKFAKHENYLVYGLQDFTKATILTADEIISLLPKNKDVIWVRDEGHINTNRWEEILRDRCINIVNFSATNTVKHGISCNFSETMMLRTVTQQIGEPIDAIKKLIEIKQLHKNVKNYNPCALFRLISIDQNEIKQKVIELCDHFKLKYIDLTDEEFIMSDICQDDNQYDVIINKMKVVEGIDIRRAHILYMDNKPKNLATTIQIIGRCRRNALLWREDVDLFSLQNSKLLADTRRCYVYFNVEDMSVDEKDGELLYELCDRISVEQLSENASIYVEDGIMPNGLQIIELEGRTGHFKSIKDPDTGFMVVENKNFYKEERGRFAFDVLTLFNPAIYFSELEDSNVQDKKPRDIPIPEIKSKWKLVTENDVSDRVKEIFGSYSLSFSKWIPEPYYEEDYYETIDFSVSYDELEKKLNSYVWDDDLKNCGTKESITYHDIHRALMTCKNKHKGISVETWERILAERPAGEETFTWVKPQAMPRYKGKYLDEWIPILHARKPDEKIYEYSFEAHISTKLRVEKSKVDSVPLYVNYNKILNDRESAIIGVDKFRFTDREWVEDKTVSTKISMHSKLHSFINKRYEKEIAVASAQKFSGKNNFVFDKKCNACLGFCVEYFTKYLLYGERYFGSYLDKSQQEYVYQMNKQIEIENRTSKTHIRNIKLQDIPDKYNDAIAIRACILCYQENMKAAFGGGVKKIIRGISISKLIEKDYNEFVATVKQLAQKSLEFIKKETGIQNPLGETGQLHDPNLSVNHISALCDFITDDTIIDLKVTNCIDDKYIKQILAYHYLSTKRDDVNIKKLIIYDAVSGKHIKIEINNNLI